MKVVRNPFAWTSMALLAALAWSAPARAGSFDVANPNPNIAAAETKDVTVVEHPGAQIPLDLTFNDSTGYPVQLRKFFTGKKPVILQLGYYKCPMLCDLISKGLADAVKRISLVSGKDYELVFVSIDPKETPQLAAAKKASYLKDYGRGSAGGWHFLTGRQEEIQALAQADGFQYKWIQSAGQFAHPAALTLCMPDGRISRYIYGVHFDPFTLRESIVEASNGKVGNFLDQSFLTCFRYDGKQGKYALVAIGMMKIGGLLIMIIVFGVLFLMFHKERRERARQEAGGNPAAT